MAQTTSTPSKRTKETTINTPGKLLTGHSVDLVGKLERGHGRYELRDSTVVGIDTEISPFPHVAQIIKETRIYRSVEKGAEPKISERIFGTSHRPGEKSVAQLKKLIRKHWTVENLNHWKRDASMWREDRAPKRHPRGAKNLALLRNALLAILPFESHDSINDAFDHYRDPPPISQPHQIRPPIVN